MPEKRPSGLGLALTYLRSARGWTKERLAAAAGIRDRSRLSRYERGDELTAEKAASLLAPLEVPPEAVELLQLVHGMIFPEPLEDATSPTPLTSDERRQIDCAALAGGWTAAEVLRKELCRLKRKEKAEAAVREAEESWTRLKAATSQDRRDLVATFLPLQTCALAVRVCEASLRAATHDAKQALELADFAQFIAERVTGSESLCSRTEGYCWAHVGNARRVANDFEGADEAFVRAWGLWRAGSDCEPELLPEWRLFSLEASLRRAQHRFAEALELLDLARASCGDDAGSAARILLKKEHVYDVIGDAQGALAALKEAAPFVEAAADPDLLLRFRFNLTADLCHLDRYGEAAELLPRVRELAIEQGNGLDLIRVVWLGARIDAGQDRVQKAIAGLEQVRRDFAVHGLHYDAALASLDLAVLWLKAGRTAQVRDLAVEMEAVFRTRKIHREALAALSLFCEAAKKEIVTVDLAKRIIAELEKVRNSAPPS